MKYHFILTLKLKSNRYINQVNYMKISGKSLNICILCDTMSSEHLITHNI